MFLSVGSAGGPFWNRYVSNRATIAAEVAAEDKTAAAEDRDRLLRSRIIDATFAVLMQRGYAAASTREIARRARVSKREIYTLFGSKRGILAAMIAGRTARMRLPLALPEAVDRTALAETLTRFGANLLREVSAPAVMALFRLAVAEAERSPELARALDQDGRRANRAALADFLAEAVSRGQIAGAAPEVMAGQFLALLWGDLPLGLLMRLAEAPAPGEAEQRARDAASALLALYPER
jgi:AcrR family transcriptional regulator